MVILQFAAGSFHTKILCSRPYSTEIEFYKKKQKIAFWATLWGLRGNVCTPSIARWKARGRLPIRHNWTLFAIAYGWDVVSGKSAFFEGYVSLWKQISNGRGRRPPTTVGVRKLDWLPFVWYQNIRSALFGFVTKHACDRQTDRRTDGQADLRQLIPLA